MLEGYLIWKLLLVGNDLIILKNIYMKKLFSLSLLVTLLVCSCHSDKKALESQPLFMLDNCDCALSNKKLSELFKDYKLVQLETKDDCLIGGRGNKIIKRNSVFYILSQNAILRFDKEGHYINKLAQIGNGPEDYTSIFDFDVLTLNGTDEIWLSTVGGIKVYDASTCLFKRTIPVDGFVNQFKYVNDHTLWIVCPEDTTFKVCNMDGSVRYKFMEKDVANSGYKFHPFFSVPNKLVYQLDDTQTGVVYEMDKDSLYCQQLIESGDRLLTPSINQAYYRQFGYENQPIKVAEDYVRTSTIRTLNNKALITQFYPDGKKTMTIYAKGKVERYAYGAESEIENDIIDTKDLAFLSTLICSEGDDAFIFMIPADSMIDHEEEDNPCLLEVYM